MIVSWHDRRLGAQRQNVTQDVGDFVLKRADGLWAYQLAVVVDDAAQRITHVVRGEDLADNTPRQIHLQRLLGVPTPAYLHTPLVLAADGEKLSKSNGAVAIEPGAAAVRAALANGSAIRVEADALDDMLVCSDRAMERSLDGALKLQVAPRRTAWFATRYRGATRWSGAMRAA